MRHRLVGLFYPPLPVLWANVEVLYAFRAKKNPEVSHYGFQLAADTDDPLAMVVRVEWDANVYINLIFQARRGFLFRLLPTC